MPQSKTVLNTGAVKMLVSIVLLIGAPWGVRGQTTATQTAPTASDDAGFESIFDGKSLKGWEGDAKYWRVENGSLVGEVTPETILKQNSFIIWRGGVTRDFELKVEY